MERLQKVRGGRPHVRGRWTAWAVGGGSFPTEGQVGRRRCHLVAARGAAPRVPRDLGKPSLASKPGPRSARPSARWRTLPAPALARTLTPTARLSLSPATTDLPWERQLLPRLQCSWLSLQHRGEYLSATSTLRQG